MNEEEKKSYKFYNREEIGCDSWLLTNFEKHKAMPRTLNARESIFQTADNNDETH